MGSVSSFWCHICACKFMLAYIYHTLGVEDDLKYSSLAAIFFLLCWENVGKINKNQYSLKMYITMKYQFI